MDTPDLVDVAVAVAVDVAVDVALAVVGSAKTCPDGIWAGFGDGDSDVDHYGNVNVNVNGQGFSPKKTESVPHEKMRMTAVSLGPTIPAAQGPALETSTPRG